MFITYQIQLNFLKIHTSKIIANKDNLNSAINLI